MKHFIIMLLLCPLLWGCSHRSGFEITGKIKSAKGMEVRLDKLMPDKIVLYDSITINEDGNFIFDGKLTEPTFFMLSLSKNDFLYLLIDTCDKITLEADASNLHKTYSIKGSEGSSLLQKLHKHLLGSLEKIDSLGLIYRKYYNTPQVDSVTKELNIVSNKILSDERGFLLSFIHENAQSLASYIALFQQLSLHEQILTTDEYFNVYESVEASLKVQYPNSMYVKKLSSLISQVKGRKKEQEIAEARIGLGAKAPDINMPGTNGKDMSLSSLRGQYVLLDFWASWCNPCRKENPNLVNCYKKFHAKGFEIFQVSLDKTKDDWLAAIKKDQLNWKHVSDLKFWDTPAAKLYALKEIPSNFLLDKDGKIIGRNLMGDALETKLKEVLK